MMRYLRANIKIQQFDSEFFRACYIAKDEKPYFAQLPCIANPH